MREEQLKKIKVIEQLLKKFGFFSNENIKILLKKTTKYISNYIIIYLQSRKLKISVWTLYNNLF